MDKFTTCILDATLPLYICVIVLKFVVVTLPFSEDLFNIDSCGDRYKPLLYHVPKKYNKQVGSIIQITNTHSSSLAIYHGRGHDESGAYATNTGQEIHPRWQGARTFVKLKGKPTQTLACEHSV